MVKAGNGNPRILHCFILGSLGVLGGLGGK
jgi:hypothetical protein